MTLSTRGLFGTMVVLAGCGSAPRCPDERESEFVGESTSGSATFALSGEITAQPFRVTIRGLPELWPGESPIREAAITTTVEQRFAQDVGSNGRMPYIAVSFGSGPAMGIPALRNPRGTLPPRVDHLPLLDCAEHPEGPCCGYGSTGCSFTGTLFVSRAEGTELPPVTVDWDARARLVVAQCPTPSSPVVELVPEDEP